MSETLVKQHDGSIRFNDLTGMPTKISNLPVGVYNLQLVETPRETFYQLQPIEDLTLPKKLYGDFTIVERVLTAFENSDNNIAIGLFGRKGGGKTITAKKICIDSGLPVIIINRAFYGSMFLDFMSSPELDNCVFFIDEFEKIYNTKHNDDDPTTDDTTMLQILDGTRANRKLFVLTSNDESLGANFTNRLGRVKYRELYTNLHIDTVIEVATDMLDDIKHLDSVIKFHKIFKVTTFDILTKLIEDINLFDEDAIVCSKYLNIEFEDCNYLVELHDDVYSTGSYPKVTFDPYSEVVELCDYIYYMEDVTINGVTNQHKKSRYVEEDILKSDLVETKNGYSWFYKPLNITFYFVEQSYVPVKHLVF